MKAFLNRFGFTKEKDRDRSDALREKIPQLPPLPDWPPQRSTATPTSLDPSKPLPDLSDRTLPPPPLDEPDFSTSTESSATPTPIAAMNPLPPADPALEDVSNIPPKHESVSSSRTARQDHDSAGRSSRKTTNGSMSNGTTSDIQKKVAFLSPPPTPGPTLGTLPETDSTTGVSAAPTKSTVSRFQATHTKDTRGSTSTAASSKTDVASTTARSTRQASTRTAASPFTAKSYNDGASIHQSLRSGTPYSQMTNASSRILLAQSWSEVAEEDLVSNIGQRERTRQEVLWEIVASEERCVAKFYTRRWLTHV